MLIEFLLNGLAALVFGIVFFTIVYYLAYRAGVFDDEESTDATSSSPRQN